MESTELTQEIIDPIQVNPIARWDIYYRLLDLAIPCSCEMGQPLRVHIHNAHAAIQLWSVVKQATASRDEQIEWLNSCWGV